MNEETLKEAYGLLARVQALNGLIAEWERWETPVGPEPRLSGFVNSLSDAEEASLRGDRDTWAIYRRTTINKIAAQLEEAQKAFKAL